MKLCENGNGEDQVIQQPYSKKANNSTVKTTTQRWLHTKRHRREQNKDMHSRYFNSNQIANISKTFPRINKMQLQAHNRSCNIFDLDDIYGRNDHDQQYCSDKCRGGKMRNFRIISHNLGLKRSENLKMH